MCLLPLILSVLTAFPHHQAPQQQSSPTFRVAGIIIDAATALPVPHAEVFLSGEDSEDSIVISGEDGRFVFTDVPPGKYPLAASAPRYLRESFNQHGSLSTAMVVGPGLDCEHIVFRLHRQAVITGRITDERGEPIRFAQVMLFGNSYQLGNRREKSMSGSAQSNDLGEYRFASLRAGSYSIAVVAHPWYQRSQFHFAKPSGPNEQFVFASNRYRRFGASTGTSSTDPALDVDYPLTFYPGVTDGLAASEIALLPGDTVEADIQLQAVPNVHIRVRNLPADSQSPPSIDVRQNLFGSVALPVPNISAEISPGEYEIAGLAPGNLSVSVAAGGPQLSFARNVLGNFADGQSLDVNAASPSASITGRVIFPPGEAVPPQAGITLFNEPSQSVFALIQKDGTFSMPSVPPGNYKIAVNMNVQLGTFVDVTSVVGAATDGRTITLSSAGDVQLKVRVSHGLAQLSGFARLNNQPSPGVMVLLVPASGRNLDDDVRIDQSDSDGSFSLSQVRPGNYFLLAIDNAWDLNYDNAPDLAPYLPKAVPIQLAAGDRKDQSIDTQLYAPRAAPSPKP
jgi:hypothetical protein